MKKIFKRVFALAAVGAAGVLLLTGCGAEEKFIGEWNSVKVTRNGKEIESDFKQSGVGYQFEIKENGSFKAILVANDTDVLEGNWEIDEEDDDVIHISVKGKEISTLNYTDNDDMRLKIEGTEDWVELKKAEQ